jgi:hypothetical protein
MANYCVNRNAQDSGDHEVHNLDVGTTCLPLPENRIALGNFSSCHQAVAAAKNHYSQVNGCRWCAEECNTG